MKPLAETLSQEEKEKKYEILELILIISKRLKGLNSLLWKTEKNLFDL